jgi:hypothetical protein
VARLHAALSRERGEVAAALAALMKQHGEMAGGLKLAAEEAASLRGAEEARQAEAHERQRELQHVARDLEDKIGAIRTAASLGVDASTDLAVARSGELQKLEASVAAAAEEVARIETRLMVRDLT